MTPGYSVSQSPSFPSTIRSTNTLDQPVQSQDTTQSLLLFVRAHPQGLELCPHPQHCDVQARDLPFVHLGKLGFSSPRRVVPRK